MRFFLILIVPVLFSLTAYSVSRVGGGKVRSQSSGFEMDTAKNFDRIEVSRRDELLAKGPFAYQSGRGLLELFIRIAEFSADFPDAIDLSRESLEARFLTSGWATYHTADSCISAFVRTNSQLTSYIATWGNGKGFILNGPSISGMDESMQEMLSTLKLDPGSCAWK